MIEALTAGPLRDLSLHDQALVANARLDPHGWYRGHLESWDAFDVAAVWNASLKAGGGRVDLTYDRLDELVELKGVRAFLETEVAADRMYNDPPLMRKKLMEKYRDRFRSNWRLRRLLGSNEFLVAWSKEFSSALLRE